MMQNIAEFVCKTSTSQLYSAQPGVEVIGYLTLLEHTGIDRSKRRLLVSYGIAGMLASGEEVEKHAFSRACLFGNRRT